MTDSDDPFSPPDVDESQAAARRRQARLGYAVRPRPCGPDRSRAAEQIPRSGALPFSASGSIPLVQAASPLLLLAAQLRGDALARGRPGSPPAGAG